MYLAGMKEIKQQKPVRYVEDENGCHNCTSHFLDKDGYPGFTRDGKNWRISRWMYTQKYGEIPPKLVVRHKCDNPTCINVDHLEIGTMTDNNQDRVKRGRSKYRCGDDHAQAKLTSKQVEEIYLSIKPANYFIEKYNIGKVATSAIKKEKIWKHLIPYMNNKIWSEVIDFIENNRNITNLIEELNNKYYLKRK